jgi:hypothetical protein
MMLLLVCHKLRDDREDDGGVRYFAGEMALRGAYRKVCGRHPQKSREIDAYLRDMRKLEIENCASFDRVTEPFALLMEVLLDYEGLSSAGSGLGGGLRYAFRKIGRSLGRWICLMDAFDDLEKDISRGAYNPLRLNYAYGAGENAGESPGAFRARIRERIRAVASLYLSEISNTADLLPIKKNKGILENIIYMGLLRKTDEVLSERVPPRV